jgi:hypothetical protein
MAARGLGGQHENGGAARYGPICPGCQYVEWHPHCTSLVDVETGERVDPAVDWAAMPRDEWELSRLTRCEHIDLTVVGIETEGQMKWRCPDCGGTTFEWVHRDYPPSGLRPGGFRAELDED